MKHGVYNFASIMPDVHQPMQNSLRAAGQVTLTDLLAPLAELPPSGSANECNLTKNEWV